MGEDRNHYPARSRSLNTRERVHILVVEGHGETVVVKWGKETSGGGDDAFCDILMRKQRDWGSGESSQLQLPVTHLLWQGLNLLTFSI